METASGRQAGAAGRQPVSLPVGDPGARWRDPRHIQLFHAGGQGDQARALRGSLGEGRRLSYFLLAAGCSILSSWARMFLSLAPKKPSSSWSPRMIPRASMKSMYGTIRMPSRLSFHCTNFFTWASFVMPAAKFGSNALRYIGKLLVTPSSKAPAHRAPVLVPHQQRLDPGGGEVIRGVKIIVPQEVIGRAVHRVSAALAHGADNAPGRGSEFRSEER